MTVDHNRWFDPVVQQAAAIVNAGRLGRLVGVDLFQGAEAGEADKHTTEASHWSARLPGGLLNNLASHPLYLMRRFAGPVRDLRVVARQVQNTFLEEVRLIADGEHAMASVTMSLRAQPFMARINLLGTEASLDVNLNNMTLIERRTRALPKLVGKVWPNLSEAGQLVTATVRNTVAFHRQAALLPRHRPSSATAVRRRRVRRGATGERGGRPRRRRLVRRDPRPERHRARAGGTGGVTRESAGHRGDGISRRRHGRAPGARASPSAR